jgi:hypothetical protein
MDSGFQFAEVRQPLLETRTALFAAVRQQAIEITAIGFLATKWQTGCWVHKSNSSPAEIALSVGFAKKNTDNP